MFIKHSNIDKGSKVISKTTLFNDNGYYTIGHKFTVIKKLTGRESVGRYPSFLLKDSEGREVIAMSIEIEIDTD